VSAELQPSSQRGRSRSPTLRTREVGPMSEPVVFISHFAVKEGALDELKRMSGAAVEGIREGKPRTVLFLSYPGTSRADGSRSCTPSATPTRWTSTSRVPTIGPPRRTSSSSPGVGSSTGNRASGRWKACERRRRSRRPAGRRTGVQFRVPAPRAGLETDEGHPAAAAPRDPGTSAPSRGTGSASCSAGRRRSPGREN
jgi:hypothetical protein